MSTMMSLKSGLISWPLAMLQLCAVVAAGQADEPEDSIDGRPILETPFNEPLDESWILEGQGRAEVVDDQLVLQQAKDAQGIVLWQREKLPEDFRIRFTFSTSNEEGLLLIFFCAQGLDGHDVFEEVDQRNGNFRDLTRENLASYHLSLHRFYPDGRHNPDDAANLRKNPAFEIVASHVPDPCMEQNRPYEVVIEKRGSKIRTFVDGASVHEYTDTGEHGPVLSGGHLGIRARGSASFQVKIDELAILKR